MVCFRSVASLSGLMACFFSVSPIARTAESQGSATDGFSIRDVVQLSPERFSGGLLYTPDGDLLVLVGHQIRRHSADGDATDFAMFAQGSFGSFLTAGPEGDAVYAGTTFESRGDIFRIPVGGGDPALVDNIPFNYDLAFDSQGRGFVSAAPAGEQRILLLDADPTRPSRTAIDGIPGFSGPLAFDDAGRLYYGTADLSSETGQSIVRFGADQLQSAIAGEVIDFSAGEVILSEIPGINSMVHGDGKLFFTDLGFSSPLGAGNVQMAEINEEPTFGTLAVFQNPRGFTSPTYLAFRPGDAPFAAGEGENGGTLACLYSDFSTVHNVAAVSPKKWFLRGEINGDGEVDMSDAVYLLNFLFLGGDSPSSREATDVNANGDTDLTDALYLLNFLFIGGPTIPPPFPEAGFEP